jgi:hypothetical protein
MSALPPKADITGRRRHVRFVPLAEVGGFHSITSLARASKRFGGLEIDHQLVIWSELAPCHDTHFIAAKVSTTGRLITPMMPMPG